MSKILHDQVFRPQNFTHKKHVNVTTFTNDKTTEILISMILVLFVVEIDIKCKISIVLEKGCVKTFQMVE